MVPSEPLISFKGVRLSYPGAFSLEIDEWSVKEGEFWALLGPNGSGKTTLLRAVCGLHAPDNGRVRTGGGEPGPGAGEVAYLPAGELVTPLTVRQYVALAPSLRKGPFSPLSRPEKERVERAIVTAGVGGLAERPMSSLSSGERQRARVARALAQEARLLLLDEPTAHLDISAAFELFETLTALQREGKTVVASLHDLNLALRYAQRVMLLHDGKVTQGDTDRTLTPQSIRSTFGIGARDTEGGFTFFPL